jgi:hypothetical protein
MHFLFLKNAMHFEFLFHWKERIALPLPLKTQHTSSFKNALPLHKNAAYATQKSEDDHV